MGIDRQVFQVDCTLMHCDVVGRVSQRWYHPALAVAEQQHCHLMTSGHQLGDWL